MWKENDTPKVEPWALRFYGIEKEEFLRLAGTTSLPVLVRDDITCLCYEWFQHAKTDLGIFYKALCNSHGRGEWKEKRRQVKFDDGAGIVIGRIDNFRNCNFLQK